MNEVKNYINDSRPMSAKNPITKRRNNSHHLKKGGYHFSEKENEKLNNFNEEKKIYNLLNSPSSIKNKNILILENTLTSKNLLSEIKVKKEKNYLPKIPSTAGAIPRSQKKIIIDAEKSKYSISKDHSDSIDLSIKPKSSSNNLIINCKKRNNNLIKEIPNKIIKNRNLYNDNNLIEYRLFVLTEKNKEKGKLNKIDFRKNSYSKNNKSIEKLSINYNIQNKKNSPSFEKKENNEINKEKTINSNCKNNNINNKKEENDKNIKEVINNKNEPTKVKIEREIKKDYSEDINSEIGNQNNNIDINTQNINTKIASNDKSVKFKKEVSIIDILKEKMDDLEQKPDNNKNYEKEINNGKFLNKNKNEIQNNDENKNSNNNSNDTNSQNSNLKNTLNDEIKYSNYDIKQIVKNSANSNKNLSEISEHINVNLSTSKFDPELASSNNKANGESNSDKKCEIIQSLSNIENDNYLHKTISCKDREIILGEFINKSSKTKIYKGIDLNNGELICIKRYINNNSEEFQNEKEIYELIQEHENIIKYYGFKNEDESDFLILEYASEDNLKNIIKLCGGSLKENLIRNYTRQILKALLFLHKNKNVAHCNIKSSNILLDKNGIIKLIDFGSAKILNKQNLKENNNKNFRMNNNENSNINNDIKKLVFGLKDSWPWCAPEVFKNEFYGPDCDIWSLGCTIIEMGGIQPWNNTFDSYEQYIENVGKSDKIPEIPNYFTNELKDFVLNCLEKNPEKRADASKLLNHFFIMRTKLDNKTILIA